MRNRPSLLPSPLSIEDTMYYPEAVKTPSSAHFEVPRRTFSALSSASVMSNNQLPYLYTNTSQSMTIAHQPTTPPHYHTRAGSQHNGAFFSKKLKSISRSKTPNDLRTSSSVCLYPPSSYSEPPRSPVNSSLSVQGQDRPFSPWGSTDSSVSTSPRGSTAIGGGKQKSGIFRSFSPTATSSSMSNIKGRPRKTSSGLDQEFDPTMFRKNRSRPKNVGKGSDALYSGYDDLFEDDNVVDETDSSMVSDFDLNDPEDGFFLRHDERQNSLGRSGARRPSTPPRSVPSPYQSRSSSNYDSPIAPTPPSRWRRPEERAATPPRSNPPSISDVAPPSPTQIPISLPPTPPPKPEDNELTAIENDRQYSIPERSASPMTSPPTEAIASPGPPPGHAPPLPPSRKTSRKGSIVSRKSSIMRNGSRRSQNPEGLGISNIPSPTVFTSHVSTQRESWVKSPGLITRASITPDLALLEPIEADIVSKGFPMLFEEVEDMTNQEQDLYDVAEQPETGLAKSEGTKQYGGVLKSQGVEALLDSLMLEAKAVSAHVGRTGYTPQMRIVDVRDLDHEFGVVSPDSDIPESPESLSQFDTMKEVVYFEPNHTDTMKEVVMEAQTAGNLPKAETAEDSSKDAEHDTTYLRVFRNFLKTSGENDAFVHRYPRFDALQAQRICSYLRRDYPLVASKRPNKRLSQNLQSRTSRIIKQREVGEELLTSLWALMAFRWLNFGRVVFSPGHEILLAASARRLTKRWTVKGDKRATEMLGGVKGEEVEDRERRRVLDLGGQPVADWGWHCAYDYPKSKVYTVTARQTKEADGPPSPTTETTEEARAPQEASKSRGPKNHRHLTVSYLWRLPFPDNHFDVVSARTLYTTLKTQRHAGRNSSDNRSPQTIMDEWDLCLEECLRVLKPGGFLEYFLFDNDIINPGPLGQNLTKNFTSQLGSMGYDPTPTSRWISRLNKAGYGEIKRGWIFCPMSPPAQKPKVPSKEDYDGKDKHGRNPSISSQDVDTVKEEVRRKMEAWEDLGAKKGSTENAAPVSGLLGSWIWEKWMLKTNAEARHLSEWELAMNQIGGVLEEGKERGSGWRCMVGWARKPLEAPVVQAAVLTAGRFRADSTASIAESRTAGRLRADSAASIAESRATGRFRADSTTSTAESRKTYYSSLSRRN